MVETSKGVIDKDKEKGEMDVKLAPAFKFSCREQGIFWPVNSARAVLTRALTPISLAKKNLNLIVPSQIP